MFKRLLALALAGILLQGFSEAGFAKSKTAEEARFDQVRAAIAEISMGKETRVEIRLRDKRKLAGYITEIANESFGVTDLKTGTLTVVSYSNVTQVKGHRLSNRADNIMFFAIAIGIIVLAGIFGRGDR